MPYTKYEWKDGKAGETPITAERLNHIEAGLEEATSKAESASTLKIGTTAQTAKAGNWTPSVENVTGLQAILDGYESRIAALESASSG